MLGERKKKKIKNYRIRKGRNMKNENLHSNHLNSDKPVFITNKKGEIIEVNDAFCNTLGIKRSDIIGNILQESNILTSDSQKKAMHRQRS